MVEEIWKDIFGYENLYSVSNYGRVKSLSKTWNSNGQGRRSKGETFLNSYNRNGYPMVVLCKDSIKKAVNIHRLVAAAFCENPNGYPIVNHLNSKKDDNYFENLEWTTYHGNAVHAFKNGRRIGRKGTSHPLSKYSERDIKIIRKMYFDKKYNQREIAEMYEDYQSNISRIILGRRWSHI